MHYCQRVIKDDDEPGRWAVIDKYVPDYKYGVLCGKPAFYCQQGPYIGNDPRIKGEMWLCADCFNEYEAFYGEGSWEWTVEDYAPYGHWDDEGNFHQDRWSRSDV